MSTPYPTKTRMDLLAAVRDGKVVKVVTHPDVTPHDLDKRYHARVTARVTEALAAGWIELDPGPVHRDPNGPGWQRAYLLTDSGREVLHAASRPPQPAPFVSGPCATGQCDDCGARDCQHDCSHEGRRRFFEQLGITGGAL